MLSVLWTHAWRVCSEPSGRARQTDGFRDVEIEGVKV